MGGKTTAAAGLGAPKPGQNVGRHDCYTGSGCNSRKRFLRAGFSVRKDVAASLITIAIRLAALATVPVNSVWMELMPESNGEV